jgi:hypothetical protein
MNRYRPCGIEMHNLARRMHTSIGATCSEATGDGRIKGAECCLQDTLDAWPGFYVLLTLPAAIARPVILDAEGNPTGWP